MSSGFFRGTNTEQDSRWGDAEKKLLRRTKFSKVLEQKVNMKKVNMDVMQRWIAQRITSLLGFEDDIVVGTCVNYLSEEGKLDPKKLQLQLTGFLEKSTGMFMEELWGLLLDAQNSLGGIPSAFLQEKKQEMLQAKEDERKQEEDLRRRMAEHEQEMQRVALLAEMGTTNNAGSSSTSDNPPSRRPTEGRRASRWGSPPVATMTTTSVGGPTSDAEKPVEDSASATSGLDAEKVKGEGNDEPSDEDMEKIRDPSPSDALESPQKPRKHSRSRRDDEDDDGGKEKKRKSRSKHGKKSDRKKRSRHKDGQDRAPRRSRKEKSQKSGDEGSSSDDDASDTGEGVSGVDVEEALRQKVMASVASKREQQAARQFN